MKKLLFAILFFVSLHASAQPFRGVWLTNVASDALSSRQKIKETVDICSRAGINTIFMVVWNKGVTLYPSAVMQKEFGIAIDPAFKGRDPLQELIEEAGKKNIAVHAWFEFGFAAAYDEAGKHILQKHSSWAAINKDGQPVVKNHFHWMNAFDPQVQQFVQSLVLEVVKKYKVAGVQGDDRLPALPSEAGYDAYTVSLYKKEHVNVAPPTNSKDSAWINWRADKLTAFLKKLYSSVKAIKPNVLVTTAPSIHPWGREEYLQNWPEWLQQGITDFVFVQLYRYNFPAYDKILQEMAQQAGAKKDKVYPGVLLSLGDGYVASDTLLQQMIEANRKANIKGEVFFYYEGVKMKKDFFEKVYSPLRRRDTKEH